MCVTEVIAAISEPKNEIVGIITINSCEFKPSIVGLYVLRKHRTKGIGYQLFKAAVDHLLSKNSESVYITILNPVITKMVEKLPQEKRIRLQIEYRTDERETNMMLNA